MELAPKLARVERDGVEQDIPAADLQVGDLVLVRPGEKVHQSTLGTSCSVCGMALVKQEKK